MIRKYNYHNWSSFIVREYKQKPAGPHYGVLLFQYRNGWSPGYDKNDSGHSFTEPETTYFAFTKKEDLELWVSEASKEQMNFIFFYVPKLGEATMKVEVKTDL